MPVLEQPWSEKQSRAYRTNWILFEVYNWSLGNNGERYIQIECKTSENNPSLIGDWRNCCGKLAWLDEGRRSQYKTAKVRWSSRLIRQTEDWHWPRNKKQRAFQTCTGWLVSVRTKRNRTSFKATNINVWLDSELLHEWILASEFVHESYRNRITSDFNLNGPRSQLPSWRATLAYASNKQ